MVACTGWGRNGKRPGALLSKFLHGTVDDAIAEGLPYYFCSVDDIITALPTCNDAKLLQKVDALHPSLKFTHKFEQNASLPFLDTLVTRKDRLPGK